MSKARLVPDPASARAKGLYWEANVKQALDQIDGGRTWQVDRISEVSEGIDLIAHNRAMGANIGIQVKYRKFGPGESQSISFTEEQLSRIEESCRGRGLVAYLACIGEKPGTLPEGHFLSLHDAMAINGTTRLGLSFRFSAERIALYRQASSYLGIQFGSIVVHGQSLRAQRISRHTRVEVAPVEEEAAACQPPPEARRRREPWDYYGPQEGR